MIAATTLAALALGANAMTSPRSTSLFPRHFELENYKFSDYLSQSGKSYEGEELLKREKTFLKNMEIIAKHNGGNSTWKMGVNRFTDMYEEEIAHFYGGNKQHMRANKKLQSAMDKKVDLSSLPERVDWREKNVVTSVKDQGHCGSCWAHAAVETIESFVALNSGLLLEVSQQELVSCMPNDDNCGGTGGCYGATATQAFDYLAEYGLAELWSYGYLPEVYWNSATGSNGECLRDESYGGSPAVPRAVTASGYNLLTRNDYGDVMRAVATLGPLAVNVDASNWHMYESGVFSGCPQEDVDINHVVQLVGYGTDEEYGPYWLIRNSWSPTYGEEGYIRIQRFPDSTYCGTDYHNGDGVGCDYDPTVVEVCGMCGVLYDVSYPTDANIYTA